MDCKFFQDPSPSPTTSTNKKIIIYLVDNILKKGTSKQHTATNLVNSFIYPTGFVWLLHTLSGIKQDSMRKLFLYLNYTVQRTFHVGCEQLNTHKKYVQDITKILLGVYMWCFNFGVHEFNMECSLYCIVKVQNKFLILSCLIPDEMCSNHTKPVG